MENNEVQNEVQNEVPVPQAPERISLEELISYYCISLVHDIVQEKRGVWIYEWIATTHGWHGAQTSRGTGSTPRIAVETAVSKLIAMEADPLSGVESVGDVSDKDLGVSDQT